MTLYSAKGGVETYRFHYTANSNVPIEASCWNEGENPPIQVPLTVEDLIHTTEYLVAEAQELIRNFQPDSPRWFTDLGGSLASILSAMLDCAPNSGGVRYVSSAIFTCKSSRQISQLALTWFAYFLWPCPSCRILLCVKSLLILPLDSQSAELVLNFRSSKN
ncbi:uncharacterized protein BT62DRAFT_251467 [Guyanagaster necrorhizus]|uniref:Uncharacterized protein n=1 Tax=Guyanagaster necrorhizus TaxID=856835 RepID=A0A9P8AQG6_9AGAR|nr:uncharacterized protein BT62DRAFT_251467 [Guyanagaster necrorhizus MCA 3950]KAG7444094.1 hypothetical protein BT62DRAFT_251467 [Guyanagaster necrorhizus MCA 3950]